MRQCATDCFAREQQDGTREAALLAVPLATQDTEYARSRPWRAEPKQGSGARLILVPSAVPC